jgi:hypothetical protein
MTPPSPSRRATRTSAAPRGPGIKVPLMNAPALLRNALAPLLLFAACAARGDEAAADPGRYFAIEVVDEQTGRGVPMVELQATNGARYYTDSGGPRWRSTSRA